MVSRNVRVLRVDEVVPLIDANDAKLINEKCDKFMAKRRFLPNMTKPCKQRWTQAQKDEAWLDHLEYIHTCRTAGGVILRWCEY